MYCWSFWLLILIGLFPCTYWQKLVSLVHFPHPGRAISNYSSFRLLLLLSVGVFCVYSCFKCLLPWDCNVDCISECGYCYIYVASTSVWSVNQTSELSVESVYFQLHWYLFIISDMDLRNMFWLDSWAAYYRLNFLHTKLKLPWERYRTAHA